MKNFFLFFLLSFLVITQSVVAQNTLEKVELKISLEGEPTIEEAGLSDRKSSWKVKYYLRLVEIDSAKPKKSRLIEKGSFKNKQLVKDENSVFLKTIFFNPKITKLIASGKPFKLELRLKYNIRSKLQKKKIKNDISFVWDLNSETVFQVNEGKIGAKIIITRESDGTLSYATFKES
jgi:hypothetical protein